MPHTDRLKRAKPRQRARGNRASLSMCNGPLLPRARPISMYCVRSILNGVEGATCENSRVPGTMSTSRWTLQVLSYALTNCDCADVKLVTFLQHCRCNREL